jgi:hypothetical protein
MLIPGSLKHWKRKFVHFERNNALSQNLRQLSVAAAGTAHLPFSLNRGLVFAPGIAKEAFPL